MKLPMALNFLNDNATRGFLLHSNLIAHMGSDARWKVGGGGGKGDFNNRNKRFLFCKTLLF